MKNKHRTAVSTQSREFFESLETRRMMAVTQDAAGWTVVTPAVDTRFVYVSSSSGNDANDGSSPTAAVASLSRAKSLVRNGFADWMLLKRGDTFGSFGSWNKWGRSPQEPMHITAFGNTALPRPQINTGTTYGLNTVTSTNPNGVENIIISSLSFFPDGYNHTNAAGDLSALRMTAKGRNIVVEDVKAAGYKDNIVIAGETAGSGTVTDVVIRRSQILDAHATLPVGNGNAQGIYVGAAGQRITIEQNVLDHNGWRANTPADRTDRNHNIYIQTGAQDVIVRDNVNTQAGFYGAKLNAGGTATGNFFARNSESIYMEAHTHAEGNVVTEAVDWDRGSTVTPWGVGINTQKSPSAVIRHNLITKVASTNASGVAGIQLFNQGGVNLRATVDYNTVYSWRNALLISALGDGPGSIVIRNNDLHAVFSGTGAAAERSSAPASTFSFSNNVYSSGSFATSNKVGDTLVTLPSWIANTGETSALYSLPTYPNANRSIADYAASIGVGANFDAFIAAARNQEKANWNPALTAAAVNPWFWDGFDRGAPPAVLASRASLDKLPLSIDLTLSKDVGASLAAGDITVRNNTTGQTFTPQFSYSSASTIARLSFASALPDGAYRITIPAGAMTDRAGRPSLIDQVVSLTLIAGDANRDAAVNLDDFTTLAANFGQTGRVFSQGDFNYDGSVNLDDFTLLASNFGRAFTSTAARFAAQIDAIDNQSSSSPFSTKNLLWVNDEIVQRVRDSVLT